MSLVDLRVEVWYLYHSGFAVRTPNHFLIFDYYNDTPAGTKRSLANGVINPDEIKDLSVIVFSSHSHSDHYSPNIFDWEKDIADIKYILSNDIHKPNLKNAVIVSPGKDYRIEDIDISVLRSTDIGVAFLVCVDGITFYHAGDLNWWHWEGEEESDNIRMAKDYKEQIDSIKDRQIDIAFTPLDPRLDMYYLLGLDYLIKTVDVKTVFPMHFGDDYSVIDWIKKDSRAAGYLDKIKMMTQRGEKFEL